MDHEDSGGGWAVLAGSTVLLIQVCVLFPGLLALVALTAVFAFVLLIPAIPLLLLAGLFFAARGMGRGMSTRARSR